MKSVVLRLFGSRVKVLAGLFEIMLEALRLHLELTLLLLQLYLFFGFRWHLWRSFRRSSARYLLHVVVHRRVRHQVSHQYALVRVPHWKFYLFFAQQSVRPLEAGELVFLHHKRVGPQLNKIQDEVLDLVPAPFLLLVVEVVQEAFASAALEQLDKQLTKFNRSHISMKVEVAILGTDLEELGRKHYTLRLVTLEDLHYSAARPTAFLLAHLDAVR